MGDKTIILKVDLSCKDCDKKIRKVLCKYQDQWNIKKIEYDEKNGAVKLIGPFDINKLTKKLCCKAGDVIKDIVIPEDKPKPKHEPKPEPKHEPKPESKPERKPEPKSEPKPKPKLEPKPEPKPCPPEPLCAYPFPYPYPFPIWYPSGCSCGCGHDKCDSCSCGWHTNHRPPGCGCGSSCNCHTDHRPRGCGCGSIYRCSRGWEHPMYERPVCRLVCEEEGPTCSIM